LPLEWCWDTVPKEYINAHREAIWEEKSVWINIEGLGQGMKRDLMAVW